MKKTYISPEVQMVLLATNNIIATSPTGGQVHATQAAEYSTGFVKSESNSYNVWDDDWSK